MKRFARTALVIATAAIGAAGCSRRHRVEYSTERRAPEPAPPTPDTTPIAALRTPAGLVLGIEGTPAAVTPTSAQTAAVPATTPTVPP